MGKVMRQVKNASDEVKRNIEDSANDIKETVMSERKNHTDKEEK